MDSVILIFQALVMAAWLVEAKRHAMAFKKKQLV